MRNALFPSVFVALLLVCALQARADELITNGGFETGDFSGWTTHPATSGSDFGVDGNPHSGNFAAYFGAVTPPFYDGISQTLATVAGSTYHISFWLAAAGGPPMDFRVLWDGTVVFDSSNTGPFPYTNFTLNE